jgi:hypothetical protein
MSSSVGISGSRASLRGTAISSSSRSTRKTLDVYVFNNINAKSPAQIFHLFGLVQGQAKVSGYNTVLTAQSDELSAANNGKPVSAMTADLSREFKWSDSANTLTQTVFPGIFP